MWSLFVHELIIITYLKILILIKNTNKGDKTNIS